MNRNQAKRLTKTTFSKKTGQKIQESEQKRFDTGQIFLWSTKKNEKQTGQLVDQETDQKYMDATLIGVIWFQLVRN